MKKILSLALSLALLPVPCPVLGEAAAEQSSPAVHTLEMRQYPLSLGGELPLEDIPVYFADGVGDLPYMDLTDFFSLLNDLQDLNGNSSRYSGGYNQDLGFFEVTYDLNGSVSFLDFASKNIFFSNYDAFTATAGRSLIDILYSSGENKESGQPELFQRLSDPGMDRPGEGRFIDLGMYDIPMIAQDGKYLLPLHTLFSLYWCIPHNTCVYFNSSGIYVGSQRMMTTLQEDETTGGTVMAATDLSKAYYAAERVPRSEELTYFGLDELCMELDYFYGLKDAHNVSNFATLLIQTDYYSRLLDKDPAVADAALKDFINYHLDDLHSDYKFNSWQTGLETELPSKDGYGISSVSDSLTARRFRAAREKAFPEGYFAYQEIGNTAFVTFDHFAIDLDPSAYYELNLDDSACITDTVSLALYAHHQITRENSPIENVVLDLSLNGGGDADAAVFVIGWFLGTATITNVNTFTGAQGTAMYSVDTNLDRLFDEKDCLAGDHNLYCLISPFSFSCGNLVPWVFKTSGLVTLLGDTSGGGSCVVLPLTTVWGTSFQISGNSRLSFVKNGSFYDVDRGVDPDVHLTRLSSYYDRTMLADLINRMP